MLFPIHHRDPFALMRSMAREADRAFAPVRSPSVFPPINVWEGEEALAVTAELPGIEPSDIEITVDGAVLTLAGERRAPETSEETTWHRRERARGAFRRAVRLPFEADGGKIEARFQDGILRVVIGRPEETKPRRIDVKAA